MSGICGVLNLDGARASRKTLQEMTASMAFRGPDAQQHWYAGPVGLGHALLATTRGAENERHPASLDGRSWITAEARIDGRRELVAKLAACGTTPLAGATDAELILHAWHAWGEDCVTHLLGDFAFAIWDAPRARLFCARDPFGVKPFFYARLPRCLLFGNTLATLRRDARVSGELDELSIADFLLFETNRDPAATSFRDIRRLPPAHCLSADRNGVRVRQYWTLPMDTRVRYRAAGDYVDHFRELLGIAVTDRLRTDRVGIELTGGLDSTSIAATALEALRQGARPFEINALTVVYRHLIADVEGPYASSVAQKLGIAHHAYVADDFELFGGVGLRENQLPEPAHDPGIASTLEVLRREARFGRVALTGWDGDALLNESPKPYFRSLLKGLQWGRLGAGLASYAISQRRLVPLAWRGGGAPQSDGALDEFPAWIEPSFATRLGLRERWREAHEEVVPTHPVRPYAFRTLASVMRASNFFEYSDAGVTGIAIEHRHPLMDLRLQEFCLSLPPLPWCVKKEIVRRAMRGVLPDAVLRRPKTPLAGWPEMELLRRPEAGWIDGFTPTPTLSRYVDAAKIPRLSGALSDDPASREARWRDLRPLSLDVWLRQRNSAAEAKANRLVMMTR